MSSSDPSSPPSEQTADLLKQEKPDRPTPSSTPAPRLPLPSLNQLAARINLRERDSNGVTASPASSAARPRLAASLLRTGSSTSLSTTATATSTIDSTAVNPPSTRDGSVSTISVATGSSRSVTPAIPEEGSVLSEPVSGSGDPLTKETLEMLDKDTAATTDTAAAATERKVRVGYKNIPSLDAITARLAKARSLSIDGSAKPPEAELIEDPKTPGVQVVKPEHPLQYNWTIYHDTKNKVPFTPSAAKVDSSASASTTATTEAFSAQPAETEDYEAGLTVVGSFSTVESFCRYFNWLKPPSKLTVNSNYHLFKSGIKPMWEDEANANGGKWVLTMRNNPVLLDRCWTWLAMALVGEELEEGDEICGAVVSLRAKVDRIQLWTRSKDDTERLNAIGKKLVKLLDVSEADNIGLEFQYNTDDRPTPNKFLSIQAMPTTSFRSTFNPSHAPSKSIGSVASPMSAADLNGVPGGSGPSGAFGSFGIGIGGSGWRGAKRS